MHNSYWSESTKDMDMKFDKLNENIEVDVCVIGAGITGISTAYELTIQRFKCCRCRQGFYYMWTYNSEYYW